MSIRQKLLATIVSVILFIVGSSYVYADPPCPGVCAPSCNSPIYISHPGGNYDCDSPKLCCVTPTPGPTCYSEGGSCQTPNAAGDCPDNVNYRHESTYDSSCGGGGICCIRTLGTETRFACDRADNPLLVPVCALLELGVLTGYVINMIIIIGGVLSVIFIILGGYRIMTAQDDTDKMQRGRLQITYAIIGLVIAASVFVIMRLLASMFNIGSFAFFDNGKVYAQESVSYVQITGRLQDELNNEIIKTGEVYLYWKVENKWQRWPAKDYNNQRNPQKLDINGEYTFSVPAGQYYIKAKAEGYYDVKSTELAASGPPVRINLKMEQASEVWMIILWSGVVLFIAGGTFIILRTLIIWNKKRTIKQMVLRRVKDLSESKQKDLYPQEEGKKNG